MAYDRYQKHQKLFIFGMICLVLSMAFTFYGLYILPFLIWNINYGVPQLITNMMVNLQENYNYTPFTSGLLVEAYFLIPGAITGLISYYISNYIDSDLVVEETEADKVVEEETIEKKRKRQQDLKESANLGVKILVIMVLIVVGILFLQYLV